MHKNSEMILFDEAISIVDNFASSVCLDAEKRDVNDAEEKVLASDAVSQLSLPPFDKSAMDGYAVMAGDDRDEYRVLEFIAAGSVPTIPLKPGTASKVMTGAPVPEGTGKVIMLENTEQTGDTVRVSRHSDKANICVEGEDVKPGDVVLKAPAVLGPLEIANLISCGTGQVEVYKRLRVGILSTGDELVDEPEKLVPGKIMDSNGPLLGGLCIKHGLGVTCRIIIKDDRHSTVEAIKTSLEESDIVVLSGGVSVGDFDFVDTAMNDLGLTVHFNRVAVKPGKPMTFATTENKAVFGLPGNPVSVYLMFHLFVLRLAKGIYGIKPDPTIELPLGEDFKRKKTDRTLYVPARLTEGGKVKPVKYHGSAHLLALMEADGFFYIENGVSEISEGDKVKFMTVK